MFSNRNWYPLIYWGVIGILVIVTSYFLVKAYPFYSAIIGLLWHVLAPFITACFIAYLLHPVIKKLHRLQIPKSIAILIIYIVFFGGGTYLSYRLYPLMIHELRDLSEHLPQLFKMYETMIIQLYESTSFLPEKVHDKMDEMISLAENNLEHLIGNTIGNITKLLDMIIFIAVLPVLVFYFLRDHEKLTTYFLNYVPLKVRPGIRHIVQGIDEGLGNYLRGQFLVCLFVGVVTYIIFELLSIDYSLLLAIIMGTTNIIPYFGPIIGAVPALAIAITTSSKTVLLVIVSILVIQLIESNLIAPYIVGRSVRIHPVAIIFVLLLGGDLAGIAGMILAVPILTIGREVIRRLLSLRQAN